MKKLLRFYGLILSVLVPVAAKATPVTLLNVTFKIHSPEQASAQLSNNPALGGTGAGRLGHSETGWRER